MSDIEEKIWQFLRGDLPTVEFEQRVYDTPELETLCGPDLYLELLSVDYRDWRAVDHIKDILRDWAGCKCVTWRDTQTTPAGYETENLSEKNFKLVKNRTPLSMLLECVHCNTYWYYGLDIEDEIYYMHRLTTGEVEAILSSDQWPDCFDRIIPPPRSVRRSYKQLSFLVYFAIFFLILALAQRFIYRIGVEDLPGVIAIIGVATAVTYLVILIKRERLKDKGSQH